MNDAIQAAPTLEALRERRDAILALAAKYGAYNVRVLGSVARGEATAESDVDLLVSPAKSAQAGSNDCAAGFFSLVRSYAVGTRQDSSA